MVGVELLDSEVRVVDERGVGVRESSAEAAKDGIIVDVVHCILLFIVLPRDLASLADLAEGRRTLLLLLIDGVVATTGNLSFLGIIILAINVLSIELLHRETLRLGGRERARGVCGHIGRAPTRGLWRSAAGRGG